MGWVRDPLLAHMADKFTVGDGCWDWHGATNDSGYGIVRKQRAHRVLYELLIGPIPEGLVLDHLCRNRACVRPAHLEPVTRGENVRRGTHGGNALKTECPQGHPYDRRYTNGSSGYSARRCSVCQREQARRQREKASS